jgi:hypothetical protein
VGELITLAAIGYAAAFIVTAEVCRWWREPLSQWLGKLADRWYSRSQETTTHVRHGLLSVGYTVVGLVDYLLSCRRCLGVEAIIVWSLFAGWPGWSTVVAAAGISVFAFELQDGES